MASVTVTVAIRYALMGAILATAYFTVQGHSQTARRMLNEEKVEEITDYIDQKLHYGLSTMYGQNTETQVRLNLPYVEGGYTASLECPGEQVAVEISGGITEEDERRTLNLDCEKVNPSGKAMAGTGCLTFEKEDQNTINVNMTVDCDA